MKNRLFTNSIFMMLTTASTTFFGFFLWFLAAKIYTAEEVGVATALISAMSLIIMLSKLGLDFSIIRFFPSYDKNRIISSSIIVAGSFALLTGTIFIMGINLFSAKLSFLQYPPYAIIFLLILVAGSTTALSCTSFLAIRKASLQFIQSIVVGSRVPFMILFSAFGAMGIFSAVGSSFLLALITAYIMLAKSNIRPRFLVDRDFLKKSFHFSAGNYFSGLLMTGPTLILPVILLNLLGAKEAAYYYISFAVAALLFKIPGSVSMSLFVEGSHGENLKDSIMKSLSYVFSLLIPIASLLYIFSEEALGLMGTAYATEGSAVLRLMIIASLFTGVNSIYFAVKRIQKDIIGLIIISGLTGGVILGSSYIFVKMFGLTGAGYAWIAGNMTGSLMILLIIIKGKISEFSFK